MELFTGADDYAAECNRRDLIARKILLREWMDHFLSRKDVTKLPDGSYDVDGTVGLYKLKLQRLPLRFRHVSGSFACFCNELTTLEGAPIYVGEWFSCNDNRLTSLEYAPRYVGKAFLCYTNAKKFTEAEVRTLCGVGASICV